MRYFIFLYNCHHLRSYNDRLEGTFTCMSSDFLLWFSLWENKVNLTHLFIIIQRKRQLIMTWTRLWKRSLPKAVSFGAVYRCSLLFHGRIPSHSEILHDNFDRNINNFSPRNYTSVGKYGFNEILFKIPGFRSVKYDERDSVKSTKLLNQK